MFFESLGNLSLRDDFISYNFQDIIWWERIRSLVTSGSILT